MSGEDVANWFSSVGDRHRLPAAILDAKFWFDTKAFVNRGANVRRAHRSVLDVCGLMIGRAIDAAAAYARAREEHAVAVRPVIATGIRIDLRSAAHFAHHHH